MADGFILEESRDEGGFGRSTALHESLLGDDDAPAPLEAPPISNAATVTALPSRGGSAAHDSYVQLSNEDTPPGYPHPDDGERQHRERAASELAMARQMANARSFQEKVAEDEDAVKKMAVQEASDLEMAMKMQLEVENDAGSHVQSQEASDAELAAKLQARFGGDEPLAETDPSVPAGSTEAPRVTKKITVRVTVPPQVAAGQQLVVNVPNHGKYSVTVPDGAASGSQFLVHISTVICTTISTSVERPSAGLQGGVASSPAPAAAGPAHFSSPAQPTVPSEAPAEKTEARASREPPYSSGAAPVEEPPLPPDWERASLPDGRVFYVCHKTRTTHWSIPTPPPYPASETPGTAGDGGPTVSDTGSSAAVDPRVAMIMEAGFSEEQAIAVLAIDNVNTAEEAINALLDS